MKRIISILIAVLLFINLSATFSFASVEILEENQQDADRIASKLLSLGIIDNDLNTNNRYITRAEFASFAMHLIGYAHKAQGERIFYDVDSKNTHFDDIYSAYKLGAISMPDDKFFYPDKNITYNEMYKMLVCLLGYKAKAEALGGYPSGYVVCAKDMGLDILGSDTYVITYNLLKTFEQILEAKVPVVKEIVNDKISYTVDKDEYFLKQYYDIEVEEGLLETVGKISLYGDSALDNNFVMIDDIVYRSLYYQASDYIGCNVKFYYTEDGSYNKILYLENTGYENIVELDADDIEEFKDNKYTYYNEINKEKYLSVEADPLVLHNGRGAKDTLEKIAKPKMGTVRLIDNDANNKFDVVIISEYQNYVVGAVDANECVIYDKFDPSKKLEFNKEKDIDAYIVTDTGKEMFAATIPTWSIVSATKSSDEDYVRAVVSTKSVEGVIEEIESDGGKSDKIKVNGNVYDIALSLKEIEAEMDKIMVGASVILHLDKNLNVAGVEYPEESDEFVIVLENMDQYNDNPKTNSVRLLTMQNEVKTYPLNDNVKIDGVKYKDNDEQYDAVKAGVDIYNIARVKFDDKDNLVEMDTLATTAYENSDTSIYQYVIKTLPGKTGPLYKSFGSIEEQAFVTDKTRVIFDYGAPKEDEERYFVTDKSKLVNDTRNKVKAFAVGETYEPQVVIVESDGGATVTDKKLWIVEKIVRGVDEFEEEYNVVSVYNGTERKNLYVDDDNMKKTSLSKGDVLRADIIKDNYILSDYIVKVYDFSDDKLLDGYYREDGTSVLDTNSQFVLRLGYVYDRLGSYMSVDCVNDAENVNKEDAIVMNIPTSILKIKNTLNGPIVETGAANDLQGARYFGKSASRVIVRFNWRIPQQIIIIEREV